MGLVEGPSPPPLVVAASETVATVTAGANGDGSSGDLVACGINDNGKDDWLRLGFC